VEQYGNTDHPLYSYIHSPDDTIPGVPVASAVPQEEALTFKELCLFPALHILPGVADHTYLYFASYSISADMDYAVDYTHHFKHISDHIHQEGLRH
jgi:hypothetical protein